MILDYTANGRIVSLELLNASKHVENPTKLEYEVA
ncbi:MAG TPA: hypothetical protein DEG28_08540 [Porphyromonadaceae bacterium]|nr:hypothetical protein [Porphyromonadaceae bacterium]